MRVLIVRHSMVFWASRRAMRAAAGTQLSLGPSASVQWLGRRGLRWGGLPQLLFRSGLVPGPPEILLIHLGGNDLGLLKGKALIIQTRLDFESIWRRWPGTWTAWSHMLPRCKWHEGRNVRPLNRAVKLVNREIKCFLQARQGFTIPHPRISITRGDLYRADGVHLSDAGNDIFLQDLHVGLLEFLQNRWG